MVASYILSNKKTNYHTNGIVLDSKEEIEQTLRECVELQKQEEKEDNWEYKPQIDEIYAHERADATIERILEKIKTRDWASYDSAYDIQSSPYLGGKIEVIPRNDGKYVINFSYANDIIEKLADSLDKKQCIEQVFISFYIETEKDNDSDVYELDFKKLMDIGVECKEFESRLRFESKTINHNYDGLDITLILSLNIEPSSIKDIQYSKDPSNPEFKLYLDKKTKPYVSILIEKDDKNEPNEFFFFRNEELDKLKSFCESLDQDEIEAIIKNS